MKWIGLTGGIASGKSTVAEIIEKNGVQVVNADHVAHQALHPGTPTYAQIVQTFGPSILSKDKSIDRTQLGALVFKNESQRDKLEKIVHPFVRKKVAEIKKDLVAQGQKMAVYDVPLLFEKKMEKDFDQILLVFCDPETQIQRLMKRNSMTREQAELRLKSQIPLSEKKEKSDVIFDNNKDLKNLEAQVIHWIQSLKGCGPLF